MFPSRTNEESGHTGTTVRGPPKAAADPSADENRHSARFRRPCPLSSIRTVTVGFGITPNLLTPVHADRALAGFEPARHPCRRRLVTAGGELHPALRTNRRAAICRAEATYR